MNIENKFNTITELKKQQMDLMKKVTKIAMLSPGKRPSTAINRSFRIIKIVMECRTLENRIRLIMSQPIAPDFAKGGIIMEGKAYGKEEIILNRKKKITIEQITKFQDSIYKNHKNDRKTNTK